MKKFLLSAICLLSLQLSAYYSFGQIPIAGTVWSGSGLSTTVSSDPSTFTTWPASIIPGSAAVNVSQWNRNNLVGVLTTATNCYNSSDWTSGGTLAAAQADAKYIYFTVTNDANTELEVTNITLQSQASSTGPDNVQIYYQIGTGPEQAFGPSVPAATTASPIVLNFSGIAHVCAGQTATFKVYAWRVATTPAWTTGGTLRINDNSSMTATYVPTPVTSTAFSTSPVCEGSPLSFVGTAFNGIAPYTYSWSGPASFSSTLSSPVITSPSVTATGTYSFTATDAYTCTSTSTTAVTVYALPDTTMTITGALAFCTPGSVTLSVPNVAGLFYQWYSTTQPGGIPGANNNFYNTSTSDDYWVQIINPTTGCTNTSNTYTVTVTTTPVPVITPAGPASICAGTTLTLSTTAGGGYTYQWNNGGTPIPGATNSTYPAPATAGVYSLTVFVTNGSCSATSAIRTLTVNAAPSATTVTPPGPVAFCAGGSITLTSTSTGGVTYQWYRGATLIGGATNLTYLANITGTYTMRVTNIANTCIATSNAVTVTSNALPSANIFPSGAISICSGNTQTLTGITVAGVTFQWYKDFVAIPGATNVSYGATTAGTYKIVATRTTTGCLDSTATAAVITVNPVPVAPAVTVTGATTFCSGGTVTLTAGAVPGGTTYQWHRGATTIGGATNATYVASLGGTYSVVVTNGFGCHDTSAPPVVVTVNPLPSSVVTLSGSATFCAPGSVILSATAVAGDTYQWYNTSGPIPGETNSSYTATTSDRDSVVITSALGCVTTTAATVVNSIATPAIVYIGSPSFCTGNSILLSINATGPGIIYQWKRNGTNIPGANASSYSANSPGSYTCFVNIVGSCAVTTAPVVVTVFPAVTPVVTFDGTNVSTFNFYATYQWYINSVAIPGATTYQTFVHFNGAYRVMVTDTNGCNLLSPEKAVFTAGINELNAENVIRIYPNPATEAVHVASLVEVRVLISTIEGKTVMQTTSKNDIDLTSLSNGLYMITVIDEKGNKLKVEKLVKQ